MECDQLFVFLQIEEIEGGVDMTIVLDQVDYVLLGEHLEVVLIEESVLRPCLLLEEGGGGLAILDQLHDLALVHGEVAPLEVHL